MANFGEVNVLSGSTLTLVRPPNAKYWNLQNQDTGPVVATFNGVTTGAVSPQILNGSSVSGGAGDWLDSIDFPHEFASVTNTSATNPTAKVGSSWSRIPPIRINNTKLL